MTPLTGSLSFISLWGQSYSTVSLTLLHKFSPRATSASTIRVSCLLFLVISVLESIDFQDLYFRYTFNTTMIPLGSMFYFLIMYGVGFAFVEVVNLQNERGNPFIGKNGTYKDITWALIIAGIMFIFSGMVTLRGKDDLYSYCKSDLHNIKLLGQVEKSYGYLNMSAVTPDSPLQEIFASIDMMDYVTKRQTGSTPECHLYSESEIFNYNYFVWTLAYFVGLQFTHLDNGILS